jgi:hypothetical protein
VDKPIKYTVETGNVYKILVEKFQKRRPFGRIRIALGDAY